MFIVEFGIIYSSNFVINFVLTSSNFLKSVSAANE